LFQPVAAAPEASAWSRKYSPHSGQRLDSRDPLKSYPQAPQRPCLSRRHRRATRQEARTVTRRGYAASTAETPQRHQPGMSTRVVSLTFGFGIPGAHGVSVSHGGPGVYSSIFTGPRLSNVVWGTYCGWSNGDLVTRNITFPRIFLMIASPVSKRTPNPQSRDPHLGNSPLYALSWPPTESTPSRPRRSNEIGTSAARARLITTVACSRRRRNARLRTLRCTRTVPAPCATSLTAGRRKTEILVWSTAEASPC
jgi:hypothetical protein